MICRVRSLVNILFGISVAAFVASLTLHAATFASSGLGGVRRFFPVHIAAIALAILTVAIYKWKAEPFEAKVLPSWAKAPLVVLFLYFVLNMVSMFVVFKGGSPTMVDGSYQLTDHGKLIRYLTADEYQSLTNWELRFFSSGWMVFFAGLAGYLWHLREVFAPGYREVHLS